MKQSIILWISAIIIVFVVSFAQHISSNEFPLSGTVDVGGGNKVSFSFDKIAHTKNGYPVLLVSDSAGLQAVLFWKNEIESSWRSITMKDSLNFLSAIIPQQLPRSKVEFRIHLKNKNTTFLLPVKNNASFTFLKPIPDEINQFYFITLFAGLILAVRTALESFSGRPKTKKLTVFASIAFFSYTFVFSTVKKGVEIGAIGNGGIPLSDIFDQRSILLFSVSILTLILIFNTKNSKLWTALGAISALVIFLFAKY